MFALQITMFVLQPLYQTANHSLIYFLKYQLKYELKSAGFFKLIARRLRRKSCMQYSLPDSYFDEYSYLFDGFESMLGSHRVKINQAVSFISLQI